MSVCSATDDEDAGSLKVRLDLGPPLPFIPSDVKPAELQAYRSDYQDFRAGRYAGAAGEIADLCSTSGHRHRPYRGARFRRRVSWMQESDLAKMSEKVRRTISFCSSTGTEGHECRLRELDSIAAVRLGGAKVSYAASAFAAGAAAATGAMFTTALFYPVELVKNRLQSGTQDPTSSGFRYSGLVDGLISVWREDGVSGLFTGIRLILARSLASDFATVFFGELLVAQCSDAGKLLELPLRVVGGWCSVAITLPLEVISTRVTCSRPPVSARVAARELWREGGLGSFWRGLRVMLVLCLNPALTFTAFGWLRRVLLVFRRWKADKQLDAAPAALLQWWEAFLVGILAKMSTLISVYPLIRAKFVLQSRGVAQNVGLYQVLKQLALQEGIRGLYAGLDAQLSKSLLSSALMLAIKEQTENGWRRLVLRTGCADATP
eukprot:TRINITY_DN23036_c0_g1_i1.p1 TRINITY_DN23036_c0_g1~~TRINITY_DN23036_c0_g1_i1.p1  ORF type:complete len:435 (-),score=46.19 TRINITY_DN23036_c0_g1_i1:40-1344(-)